MKRPKAGDIVTLEILSWIGYDGDATHYYGEIKGYCKGDFQSFELKKSLTDSEVEILNKEEGHISYSRGDMTKRFNTEEELREEAKQRWRDIFPDAKALAEGSFGIIAPKPILDGISQKIMKRLNVMVEKYKKIEEGDYKKQDAAYDKWAAILLEAI
ncbi:MAG TPA: hypothetical protein VMV86_05630 [Methanosarcinales archaeon]|nr:hypothetical protein [Methanosarcinales archaeon]